MAGKWVKFYINIYYNIYPIENATKSNKLVKKRNSVNAERKSLEKNKTKLSHASYFCN